MFGFPDFSRFFPIFPENFFSSIFAFNFVVQLILKTTIYERKENEE